QSLSTPSGVATSDATSDLRVRRTHQAGALAALDISKPHGNFAGYSSIDCRAVLICRLRAALFELDLPPTAGFVRQYAPSPPCIGGENQYGLPPPFAMAWGRDDFWKRADSRRARTFGKDSGATSGSCPVLS